jgi:hypothetical protein
MRLSALSNLKYFAQGAGATLVSCICTKIIWEKNSATTAAESETFLGSDALGCLPRMARRGHDPLIR